MPAVVLITSKVITLDKEVSDISHAHEQRFQHTAWQLGKIFLGEHSYFSSDGKSYGKNYIEKAKRSC